MQEFLLSNKVSWNLMSLTGYRTLVILDTLLESPKTNDEINECLLKNQYIKEKFSADTLRLYINSLRAIGCEITRANKANNQKYTLLSHPFIFDIPKAQLQSLNKFYKNSFEKLPIEEVLFIENFIEKLANQVSNEKNKLQLLKMLVLNKINKDLILELLKHCESKNQIIFEYNSPKSGKKNIEIIADKLSFKTGKLYLWGTNLTHNQHSYFPVEKILSICGVNIKQSAAEIKKQTVVFQLFNKRIQLTNDEKIINEDNEKLLIEKEFLNEFEAMQRLLSLGSSCKILAPSSFANKYLKKIKRMEEFYE